MIAKAVKGKGFHGAWTTEYLWSTRLLVHIECASLASLDLARALREIVTYQFVSAANRLLRLGPT